MTADIPLRVTQAQMSAWWFSRGYSAGDLFDRFAFLIRAMDDAYLPMRIEQIRRQAEAERRKRQISGGQSVNGWSVD